MIGGPFKQHVLQQVGHPRFAVPFVSRADEYREVDRHGWF